VRPVITVPVTQGAAGLRFAFQQSKKTPNAAIKKRYKDSEKKGKYFGK
jgi:hypothetical protein